MCKTIVKIFRQLRYEIITQSFGDGYYDSFIFEIKDWNTGTIIKTHLSDLIRNKSIIEALLPEDALKIGYFYHELIQTHNLHLNNTS